MVEELEQAEKEERKARLKTRLLWVIIIADILLFGYAVYEIIALVVSMVK
jgi:t-SNARE complex subunit (syntaxin)